MAARLSALAITISAAALALFVAQGGSRLRAAVSEDGVEFQDGAGNTLQSVRAGAIASFYVRDADLGSVQSGVATWTSLPATVPADQWWSLATGAPHPSAFALSERGTYDTSTPANTPLSAVPTAKVNGVTTLLIDFRAATGDFKLLNNVDKGSALRVAFSFDVVDSYPVSSRRVNVTSTADTEGEWVAISEVVSETDATVGAVSAIFRGQVLISPDSSASAAGDGAVRVQPGDEVTVSYYDSDQGTVIATHQVQVEFPAATPTPTPTPTQTPSPTPSPVPTATPAPSPLPTPVPTAHWPALVFLAGVLAFAACRVRRLPKRRGSETSQE